MIKRVIDIDGYWKVIVYYNLDYDFFNAVKKDLKALGCSNNSIRRIYRNMSNGYAKACTMSSLDDRTSIVLFNKHITRYDYINSIVHEAEHVKQSMLDYYKINDTGEPPAYTVGYLASRMIMIFEMLKVYY